MTEQRIRGPRSDALRNDRLILETAARVLAEDPKATIQRIADEAGVVRLTVYRRYRNREELRRAIFDTAATEARQAIADLPADLDGAAALRALITTMAQISERYHLLLVGTDLQPLPGQTRRPTPPPASRAMHQAVLALIERGQQDGTLRSDIPAELFPLAIVGTLRITLRFAASLGLDTTSLAGQVADLLLGGLARPERTTMIDKIAWIHLEDGKILSTRSRGKDVYYLPGGKREPGETDLDTLIREISEELAVDILPATAEHFGTFHAQAHGHADGITVQMSCYTADHRGTPAPASEIEEVAWLTYADRPRVSPVDQLIFDHLHQTGRLD